MVTVKFADFKDSALKFDNQAGIAFVIDKDNVWVKTGTKSKQLCYKEDAVVEGIEGEPDEQVAFCVEHAAVQRGVDACVNAPNVSNELSMLVDTERKVVSFEVRHILTIPATEQEPEKTEVIGISKRGPFKFEVGYAAKTTIELPTGISAEVRAQVGDQIDKIPSQELAKVFELLGVLKAPIFITAATYDETKDADGNVISKTLKTPSRAFVSGSVYGEMAIANFKRGVRVSYELSAPVGKLLAKSTGDAECLARVDDQKVRLFSVQTDSFFVSGVVEKVSSQSMNSANMSKLAGLDYASLRFNCPKVLVANVTDGRHTLKLTGDKLFVDENVIAVFNLVKEGETGEHLLAKMGSGVAMDCKQIGKLLYDDAMVPFAIARFDMENNVHSYVFRIGNTEDATKPCWYLPAM